MERAPHSQIWSQVDSSDGLHLVLKCIQCASPMTPPCSDNKNKEAITGTAET